MRKIQLFLLVISCALASCNFDSESNFTPQIISGHIFLNSTDTISYKYDVSTNKYTLDTIAVSDTVSFTFGFYTYSNNLQNVSISCDNNFADITLHLDSVIIDVITAESDLDKGILYFPDGYNFVQINFDYLAKAATNTAELKLHVASDSKYSPVDISLVTPIVATE